MNQKQLDKTIESLRETTAKTGANWDRLIQIARREPETPAGYFKNGDLWYHEVNQEENEVWYMAYGIDGPYETREMPVCFPLFTMIVFPEGTPESFVREYMKGK